nr:hypothetical protein [uncultured Pedobacter sp.]
MKKLLILLIAIFISTVSFSQVENRYAGKTYIFDYYETIYKSDNLGENVGERETALLGSLFTVVRVLDKKVVIKFNNWEDSSPNKQKYNLDANRIIFFVLDKDVFQKSCSEYEKKWDIAFGTFTTPFKIRNKPFLFTTDLNLGASISFRRRFSQNFYWGVIGGLSLSSVKLDSLSTNGTVKTPSDRPAITPSINGLLGYKNINLIFGVGIDYISQTSKIEQSWVYHKKPWFGIGIGVSLFNGHAEANGTEVVSGQK